jgi:2,5-diketo-D-gluconate reductase A
MGVDPSGIASYCAAHGIVLQAYSPLGDGRSRELITGPLVSKVGEQNGRSGAQIALKYVQQLGFALVTKSTSAAHLAEDIDLFDWTLSPFQMKQLTAASSPFANYSFACLA